MEKEKGSCWMNLNRNNRDKKFEQILLDSIDEAFSTLGESAKTSIYFYLEKNFLITKQDIPYKVDDFSDALEQIFGLGARHLEILIMEKLHAKVTCSYKWTGPNWLVPDLTFRKYVELARLGYVDTEKIRELEVWIDAEEKQEQYV
jgi:hypothetical protein